MEDIKYDIEYLPQFKADFFNILYYIAYVLENDYAANKLLGNVHSAIINRKYNPKSFQIFENISDKKVKWYRIYVGNYTIFYTIRHNKMVVSRILYSKRNFEKLF